MDRDKILQEYLDDINLEKGFINIQKKSNNSLYIEILETYGKDRCLDNGLKPRMKHEVLNGIKSVKERRININTDIVNLPFTVLNKRGKAAETAFTDREKRKVFLVPDHTQIRIINDYHYHKTGFETLYKEKSISIENFEMLMNKIEKLNVGERVGASIIHEYGHILTYEAMDRYNVETLTDMYNWLGGMGYLDNCSERIVLFSKENPFAKINIALEQLAEDYRISFELRGNYVMASLPHSISYIQDIKNPDKLLEGVDIMATLLDLDQKRQDNYRKKNAILLLDDILPFGEAGRTDSILQFSHGEPIPLTNEQKQKDLEILKKYDTSEHI